jgi:hypothetical protein
MSEQTHSFSLHLPSHYENGGVRSGTSNGLRRFDDDSIEIPSSNSRVVLKFVSSNVVEAYVVFLDKSSTLST